MKKLFFISLAVLILSISSCAQIPKRLLLNGTPIVKYGALYNYYAQDSTTGYNIANVGWRKPSWGDWNTLRVYLDPGGTSTSNTAGGKLKSTGFVFWDSPNTSASDQVGFGARGAGYRNNTGAFLSLKQNNSHFGNQYSSTTANGISLSYTSASLVMGSASSIPKTFGYSVRLIKQTTCSTHGAVGTYVGNDGHVYPTICINGQEWTAVDIIETKYRDGTPIPIVTDNTEWSNLTTGGMCYYSNQKIYAIY